MGFENGSVFRVVFKASKTGRDEVNVFHYDADDGISGGSNSGQSLANAVANDALSWFRGLYDNSWLCSPVEVTEELDPQNPHAPRGQWVGGVEETGIGPTPTAPLATGHCVVFGLATAHIGRRYRGRVFVGGSPGEIDINGNNWEGTWLTKAAEYVSALPKQPDVAGGITDATCKLSVYSKAQRAALLDPYLSAVTNIETRTAVHWRRSRANIG